MYFSLANLDEAVESPKFMPGGTSDFEKKHERKKKKQASLVTKSWVIIDYLIIYQP